MGIATPGIGSGLDVGTLVTNLVNAEMNPSETRLQSKINSVNTQISDAGQLKSKLSALQTSLGSMADLKSLFAMNLTLSDSTNFTATSTSSAAKGTYQVQVQKLAQQHSVASSYISAPSSVGNGTLTIDIGKYNSDKSMFTSSKSTPVTINPGNDSLTAIRDAINSSNAGVTASVITDGLGPRLTLVSSQTGEKYAIKVTSSGGGLDALKYDPTDTLTPDGLTETAAAQDSAVKVNGLILQQSTNTVTGAISGVTLNLTKADLANTVSMNISDNQTQVTSQINDFIKKYNDAMTTLNSITAYDPISKKAGSYQGDPSLNTLKSSLAKLITGKSIAINSKIKMAADLGIKTGSDGLLQLDSAKLNTALTNNYQEVGSFFAKTSTASDSSVQVTSLGSSTKAGTYSLVLSQFTAGTSVAGTIGGVDAVASGTRLSGTGAATGIQVNVSGGLIGSRGSITVTDGVAAQANAFLTSYLTTNTGSLDKKVSQLRSQITSFNKDGENLATRRAALQARYTTQFNALDGILNKMQQVSSSLTQSLANLQSSTKA